MYKFAVTLHVLAAVLIIGPLVLAALTGYQAVRRHDLAGARFAAMLLARANIGTVVVALLGFWAVSASDRVDFSTPWVVISITLWIVMGGVASALTTPAVRTAAKLLDEGVPARPPASQPEDDEAGASPAQYSATATELAAKERLDQLAGRIAASGGLVALIAVAIVVFMVVKPFGN